MSSRPDYADDSSPVSVWMARQTSRANTAAARWALVLAIGLGGCAASTARRSGPEPPPAPRLAAPEPGTEPVPITSPLWDTLGVHVRIEADPAQQQVFFDYAFESPASPLELQLPSRWAGQTALLQHVRDLRAVCVSDSVPIEMQPEGRVIVEHGGCQHLQVSYRVVVPRDTSELASRRLPQLGANTMLLHGPAVLALPMATVLTTQPPGIGVELIVPDDWQLATNWTPVDLDVPPPPARADAARRVWRYVAHDAGHLYDSVIVAGALRYQSVRLLDGRTLQAVFRGELPVTDDELVRVLERVLEAQRVFLPDDWQWPGGTERLTVTFLGVAGASVLEGGGRRGGFVVHAGRDSSEVELAELIAHEAFHVVNGHLLVHERAAEFETLWFKEGVTTYIAALTMVRAQLADDAWFRARMSELVEAYYGNPLSLTLPMCQVERRFWTDVQARRLPYDKGALLGLVLDATAPTLDGRTPVERWIASLLTDVAMRGRAYTNADLLAAVTPIAQGTLDAPLFFARYVEGVDGLPLVDGLARLDLDLLRGVRPAPYYGLRLGVDANGTFVVEVDPDGPAARAGLHRGDRLLGEPRLREVWLDAPVRLDVIRGRHRLPVSITPTRGQRERYEVSVRATEGRPAFFKLLGMEE